MKRSEYSSPASLHSAASTRRWGARSLRRPSCSTAVSTQLTDNTARNSALGKGSAAISGSHAFFSSTPNAAANWTSPVDYRGGQMHVVVDVLEKMNDVETRLSFCMADASVTCANGWAPFKTKGRYTFRVCPAFLFCVSRRKNGERERS